MKKLILPLLLLSFACNAQKLDSTAVLINTGVFVADIYDSASQIAVHYEGSANGVDVHTSKGDNTVGFTMNPVNGINFYEYSSFPKGVTYSGANLSSLTGNAFITKSMFQGNNTFLGKQTFKASNSSSASLNIPSGVKPITVQNGDIYRTSTGDLEVNINGTIKSLTNILPRFIRGSLPSPSPAAQVIFVTDNTSGTTYYLAFSTNTEWRKVSDNSIIN